MLIKITKATLALLFAALFISRLQPVSGRTVTSVSGPATEPVRFGRDVLPILAGNCFACHGPDEKKRKAGLRLDIEESAKMARQSGTPIVPGQPGRSLIIDRVTSGDPGLVMPPPVTHRQLSPAEIETLRRWIAEGAKWGRHWSFEAVSRPITGSRDGRSGAMKSSIDDLVSASLAKRGLALRPAAAPETLVRRLWLDLIGLPPTPDIADRFAVNPTRESYERMVDDILSRPQFGEHWARMWLDLARYADTKGYEKDLGRTIWPYRDWVVKAFNSDMPLDRFTIEQLAGDLLPEPTEEQLVATAFHRNTMTNDEGGTDNEEFRVAAVKDRVDTTMQVWMGLTMGCAKCHSHKYDPISHRDYYSFYAIFNQTEDADRTDDAPTLEMLSEKERTEKARLQAVIDSLSNQLPSFEAPPLEEVWRPASIVEAVSRSGAKLVIGKDGIVRAEGDSPPEERYQITVLLAPGTYTALRLDALPERHANGQLAVARNGSAAGFILSEITLESIDGAKAAPIRFARARADYDDGKGRVEFAIDGDEKSGWSVDRRGREPHTAFFDLGEPLRLSSETRVRVTLAQEQGDAATMRRVRLSTTGGDPLSLTLPMVTPELRRVHDELAAAWDAQRNFNNGLVRLPVMRELAGNNARETKIHLRGNFLDQGESVTPAVPASFHSLPKSAGGDPSKTDRPDRLALAKWLVSPDNPLTPRVWANRIWARLFGVGIVETEEDFGAQGSAPSDPELLDWLAAEYRDNGWSLKRLLRTIVLSETYRQDSATTESLREADPRNLYLTRGARFRLGAEVIRDQALSIAGLLSGKMGGPPVMPPQPAGLWRSTYSGRKWIDAEDEDRYRRGIYTYLKRTTPYPSMLTFDGGSGEVCQIRRIRTNTPLQALITLNDPVYLEAAAGLAKRVLTEEARPERRAAHGLRLALIRPLRSGEEAPLVSLQQDAERLYAASPAKTDALLGSVRIGPPAGISKSAFASWIVVAGAILNLDELLTRN